MGDKDTPPLPAGYTLDQDAPPLPQGYTLDSAPAQKLTREQVVSALPGATDALVNDIIANPEKFQGVLPANFFSKSSQVENPGTVAQYEHGLGKETGAEHAASSVLKGAGLPTSISDIPDWMRHFVGQEKGQPFKLGSIQDIQAAKAVKDFIDNPNEETATRAVPFFGPVSAEAASDVRNGDYTGAAGKLTGFFGALRGAQEIQPAAQAMKKQPAMAANASIPKSEPEPKYAYRTRDVGEQGVPSDSHAQATSSLDQAQSYLDSRGDLTGKPQEIVRIDLNKAGKYSEQQHPDGPTWYKFGGPLPESAVEVIHSPEQGPMQPAGAPAPASVPATATPSAAAPARTSLGVGAAMKAAQDAVQPIDPVSAITRALKPGTNVTNWESSVKSALSDLNEASGGAPVNLQNLPSLIKTAKQSIWKQIESITGAHGAETVDGNQIADAMKDSLSKRFRAQNPEAAARIDATADTYRRNISMADAEEFLQDANNELHSYYAKNKVAQNVAKGDPAVGHVVAEADALRKAMADKLNELTETGGQDVKDLKRRYGALSTLEEPALKRQNVWNRQQPDSLQEQLNFAQGAAKIGKALGNAKVGDALEGAGQMAVSKFLKQRGDPNWLINHAFEQIRTPASSPSGPSSPVLASLPPGVAQLLTASGLRFNPQSGRIEQAQ